MDCLGILYADANTNDANADCHSRIAHHHPDAA
jgi:nitrate/TMAO reductase-like tetraheme cytochrome c subunit